MGGAVNDDDGAASGPQLLCLSLNQDQSCLACGTDSGFVIYDIDPFQQRCFRRDVPVQGQLVPMGPLRIVTMLFRSNIFALVGTAANQVPAFGFIYNGISLTKPSELPSQQSCYMG